MFVTKINGKKRWLVLVITFCAFLLAALFYYRLYRSNQHVFRVRFMDVGQGDATLINFESGEKMLIDCGSDSAILSALGRNLFFFDRKIDFLLVTHPDLDHYGGCIEVLKNYDIKKIFVNGEDKKGDPYYAEWKTSILKKEVEIINDSSTLNIAGSNFRFFMPDRSFDFNKMDANNFSIVFKLNHLGKKLLFTGDIGVEAEQKLLEKYCLDPESECPFQADILKVAHHGSDGSSSEEFLAAVKPQEAIISVGKNKFGHPSLRTIRHLERVGAKIQRTDENGDILTGG